MNCRGSTGREQGRQDTAIRMSVGEHLSWMGQNGVLEKQTSRGRTNRIWSLRKGGGARERGGHRVTPGKAWETDLCRMAGVGIEAEICICSV